MPAHDTAPFPPLDLVLRCDASAKIGAGHVVRSLTLAEGWQQAAGTVTLVGCVQIGWLREQIERLGIRFIALDEDTSCDQEIALLAELKRLQSKPWLILDGYRFDASYHARIRALGFQLCVIDDMAHLPYYEADVVLNQNPNAARLHYARPAQTVLLLGTIYTLLRGQFRAVPQAPKDIPAVARRLLVTFGGTDTQAQLRKVLDALSQVTATPLNVTIVGGAGSLSAAALQGQPTQHTFEFLHNVTQMVDLMQQCDIALCASGSTTYELAYLGVPMLLTAIADNQIGILDSLAQSGAALALGWHADVSAAQIAAQLDALVVDPVRRQQMSRAGQRLVDGLGVSRVISALLTPVLTPILTPAEEPL